MDRHSQLARSPSWPIPWSSRGAAPRRTQLKAAAGAANSGFLSVLALLVSVFSLGVSIYSVMQGQQASRVDRANVAVTQYLTAAESRRVASLIMSATSQGRDYSAALTDPTLKENINNRLNELELLAEGVNQKKYDEATVFKNLGVIIFKSVKAHLYGQAGSTPSGDTWTANSTQTPLFASRDHFPELRAMYSRWFPEGTYRDFAKN